MMRFISGEIETLLFRCDWHRDSHFTPATLLQPVRQLTPNLQMGGTASLDFEREVCLSGLRP